ncbi:MAG TPA: ABC transporter permease [Myxococcales bacterium]|jgi:NitT/TauT family transport system permease protein|nr:ABC transporter permease [Myxococcales bacterium]
MREPREQVRRPEVVVAVQKTGFGVVQKPLTKWEALFGNAALRKGVLLILLALAWEIGARQVDNELVFPTFTATVGAFWTAIKSGVLPQRTAYSLRVLLQGYGAGLALAAVLTALATATRVGSDLLELLTSMLNPLPSIALLPLAMLWFGLGNASLIFVLVHAVLWSVALNTHAGFRGVSQTLRMVGRNYGLSGVRYVTKILVPAALPGILTGLKIGWAFAWRTLIAAELVFGVSSGSGGLGWFIFENKNQLETASVFAGLLTVILIGLGVENLIFRTIERATIHKWGMEH